MNTKNKFMKRAIELSENSANSTGGPFGSVIVKGEKVISEGSNKVTFTNDECTLTSEDPDQYTCTSPIIQANLINPNGAVSDEVNIAITRTCSSQ